MKNRVGIETAVDVAQEVRRCDGCFDALQRQHELALGRHHANGG